MLHFIQETYRRLLQELRFPHKRYLFHDFNLNNRLTGLVGARGTGKTTLLLQWLKEHGGKDAFYFSADLVYFQESSLLEFVANLHQREGVQKVFIDEVHKYKNWSGELKNLYDAFPRLTIVFSGSSMLDLTLGSHDLSRRAKLYHLNGMSFREYLNFCTDEDLPPILESHLHEENRSLANIPQIFKRFDDYLRQGYYPFVFEDPHSYYEKLQRVIDKTIFEDIANFYQLKTANLFLFKKILTFLATIPPGDVKAAGIAKHLGVDHKTAEHYLQILASVGLLRLIYPFEGGGLSLRRPQKIFLNNTTLMHAMAEFVGHPISKGTERELFFLQSLQNAGVEVFHSKQGDFRTRHAIFEIGGKNKTRKQLKGLEEAAWVVKDDVLFGAAGEIPLIHFGMLY